MQSKVRTTYLNVPITTALKAAIESAAMAAGQSVDEWVASQLEQAVPTEMLAEAKRSEGASRRKVDEARAGGPFNQQQRKLH